MQYKYHIIHIIHITKRSKRTNIEVADIISH